MRTADADYTTPASGLAAQQRTTERTLKKLARLRKKAADEIDRLLSFLDASDDYVTTELETDTDDVVAHGDGEGDASDEEPDMTPGEAKDQQKSGTGGRGLMLDRAMAKTTTRGSPASEAATRPGRTIRPCGCKATAAARTLRTSTTAASLTRISNRRLERRKTSTRNRLGLTAVTIATKRAGRRR